MNQNKKTTADKHIRTQLSPENLRSIAGTINKYSIEYRDAAAVMEAAGVPFIEVTGMASLENRALKELNGHASTVKSAANLMATAMDLAFRAESKSMYAAEYLEPPKTVQKAKKKAD